MHFFTKLIYVVVAVFITTTYTLNAQVTANFSATSTAGCAPLFIQFNDLSTSTAGNIVSWSWNLGGTTATAQNAGKAFTTGGTYTICLTVTDAQGNTATHCKNNYVTIYAPPQAQFTTQNTLGCAPFQAPFTNTSITGSGTINLVQWAFGNGASSTSNNPTASYPNAGSYNVTLSVTDVNGCSDVTTIPNYITVQDIGVVDFSANQTHYCDTPFVVAFTNLAATNPSFTYLWNFGDGNTSTQANPIHTYTTMGNFNVVLTVTNTANGCSKIHTKNNFIQIINDFAFTYAPTTGCQPLNVQFTNTTPGNTTNVVWNFGDGYTSQQANPSHTFQADGCFFVSLTATKNGCTNTFTAPNCINVLPTPQPSYTSTNLLGCTIPHTVSFSGVSNIPNSNFLWTFGDGNTSTQQNPTHTYTNFGTFPVSLTVSTMAGCATTIVTDTVKILPVNAQFSIDTVSGCSPLSVTFSDASFSLFPITTYNWNVAGGSFSGVFTTANPIIVLTDTAIYDITLTVTNAQGCSDNTVVLGAVRVGIPPVIVFEATDTVVCVEDDVIFTNNSSGFTQLFDWDFGDGGTSVADAPTHTYADTGFYDIKLIATHNGCRAELEKIGYIEVQPARADFVIERNCNTPYTITFENQSIGGHRFFWDFGVNTVTNDTSNLENPVFTFPDRGNYQVSLTAFNDTTGCSNEYTLNISITDPVSNFSFSNNDGCAPRNINVINNSVDGNSYLWTVQGATINDPTLASPSISFVNAGTYTFYQLIITDINNCHDTIQFNDTVHVYDIYPDIDVTQDVCPSATIQFTDNSTVSDGVITNWNWTLGNGQTATTPNVSTVYNTQGSYPVSLTVTSSLGCTRTQTLNISVLQPNVNFNTIDTFVCSGQDVDFTNTSNGQGRTLTNYFWDFGDGNTSTATAPTHQYQTEGQFTVCLTVTDALGCNSTFCRTNLVRVVNPQANFTSDTTFAACPILVPNFIDSSVGAVSWQWNFGDGVGTSTAQNPNYTYVSSGSFDVQLIVADANGCTDTLIRPSYITIDGPYGNFSATPLSACPNEPVTFVGNGFNTVRYVWDFGDGNFALSNTNDTVNTVNYSYTSGGNYFPLLILEGGLSCTEVLFSPLPLVIDELGVSIVTTDTVLCQPDNVTFTPVLTSSIPIDSFYWDFGNLAPISHDTFPTIAFNTPGIYTVTLHAFNSNCTNTGTIQIRIGRKPQADFNALPTVGCTPQNMLVQNTSTLTGSYSNDAIDSWAWDFDYLGQVANTPNSGIIYPDSGDYDVQLIVGTFNGCFDTTVQQIRVNLTPTVDAGTSHTVCLQNSVRLLGSGSAGSTFQWSPAADLDNPNILQPIASPTQNTVYTLTATSPEGCISTDQVLVTVIPILATQVSVSNDTTICEGDIIQLFASGGQSVLNYAWDTAQAGLSCYQSCNNPFANPNTTTMFYVTLYTTPTCYDTDSILVTVTNENQDILGADRTICRGDSAQLNISIGSNPIFSPNNDISCVFCPSPYVFPINTYDYMVQTRTPLGCIIRDTITINIIDPTTVSAGEDLGTCPGNTLQLEGVGVGNFTWSGDNSISDINILTPTVTPTATTNYSLTVQNGDCIITDTVTVLLVAGASVENGEFTICANETTPIGVEGYALNYTWSPALGLNNPNLKRPTATLTETTTYTVSATIPNCPSAEATVTVNVIDVTDVLPQSVQNIFEGQNTNILLTDAAQNPNLQFIWSPNLSISCTTCNNPSVTLSNDQTYFVQITDVENGCVGQDTVNMRLVKNCNEDLIVVPNGFSPNNDGLNDVLYVRGSTLNFIYSFRIFSRTGELVFETTDINEGWDGTYKGERVSTGVFVYYVEAPCSLNGSVILKKGNVTIIK